MGQSVNPIYHRLYESPMGGGAYFWAPYCNGNVFSIMPYQLQTTSSLKMC